jgi:predicted amidohydrolase YtcJ
LILRNARIGDRLLDLVIVDGVIAQVGARFGPQNTTSEQVDLAGRWVLPGLWDNHVHFTQWTLTSQRVELSTAASAHEAAALMGAVVADQPLLVGGGFRDAMWADAPRLELLDATTGRVPTVLVSADLHSVWLNTAALAVYGHVGHATGLLVEDAAFAVQRQLATMPDRVVDAWARAAATTAASRGVVGIVDFEMTWNLEVWERRVAAGHDAVQVEFAIYPQHLDRAIEVGLRTGDSPHELLSVGGLKVLTDGSLGTRTASTVDEYIGGGHGVLTVPPGELEPLMGRAHRAGIRSNIHAIGDRANTLALDAFEKVGAKGSIEHAQLLLAYDIPRFAKLGVTASVQPEHAMDDRAAAERYWSGRTARMYPFRSLLDAGAALAFGSDAPVAPLDPWIGIAAAVTRERDGEPPWHPEQRITAAEALAASTRTHVALGQPADLVVTDENPLTAPGQVLRTMPVAATLRAGHFTHSAL